MFFLTGLVFNFSQLSVNEISGEQMDLEVDSSLLNAEPDILQQQQEQPVQEIFEHRHQQQTQLDDRCLSKSRTLSLDIVPQSEPDKDHVHDQCTCQPLPDIVVGCNRSASFTTPTTKYQNNNKNNYNNFQERRTMSVSLPIDDLVISHVASQLRQMSQDFSYKHQVSVYIIYYIANIFHHL